MPWAVLMRSENRLDGKRENLLGTTTHPCRKQLFETRAEARVFIEGAYGWIKARPDLKAEPHGWKMPQAVRVRVHVERV